MSYQLQEKNKKIIFSALITSVLITIVIIIWLFFPKSNSVPTQNFTNTEQTSVFPLFTDENAAYVYYLECTISEIKEETIEYPHDGLEKNLIFKLLAKCFYPDNQDNMQEVWVPLGTVMEDNNETYVAYGSRSRPRPIIPEFGTGQRLKELIEENYATNNNITDTIQITQGDRLLLSLIKGENAMAQENVNSPNGTSDFIYYGSGFTKTLTDANFDSFIQTGNTKDLPRLSNGEPLLPILRAEYLGNN